MVVGLYLADVGDVERVIVFFEYAQIVIPIHPVFCQPAIALEHTLSKDNIDVINRMTDSPNVGDIFCTRTEQEIMKMDFMQHTLDKGHTDLEGMVNVFTAKYLTRGNCETRHYIRADAIEQVVMLELRRLAKYLETNEEEFAKLLAEKTNADMLAEQKTLETELNRATARNEMLTSLFAKTYEDNVSGKLSDEMYMELSHKYEVERLELKTKIFEYKECLAKISEMEQNKDDFLKAVRKFMEMDSLTAPMLRELIDHIDVYEKEGSKKNYTQRIVIYYRFVGYLELPSSEDENYKANTRKGVDVEYIPTVKSA